MNGYIDILPDLIRIAKFRDMELTLAENAYDEMIMLKLFSSIHLTLINITTTWICRCRHFHI